MKRGENDWESTRKRGGKVERSVEHRRWKTCVVVAQLLVELAFVL